MKTHDLWALLTPGPDPPRAGGQGVTPGLNGDIPPPATSSILEGKFETLPELTGISFFYMYVPIVF